MGDAKVVSMSVMASPSQASLLCFEVGGILGESSTELGAPVAAFDFAAFYATLGSIPTIPGDPARLLYNFVEIQAFVKKFTLVALRAENGKAALNKAINARANAYYAKYANAPAIITRMNDFYLPSKPDSKPDRLEFLRSLSQNQFETLRQAYEDDGRIGVVKTTDSDLQSTLESSGRLTMAAKSDEVGVSLDVGGPGHIDAPPPGGGVTGITVPDKFREDYHMGASSDISTSTGTATSRQKIVNTDYGYRIPYLETFAQHQRAQISLIDEQFAQFMYGQNLPYLAAVFQNELNSIDASVFQMQIAYLNTILMSPIPGTVTGIYKNVGDSVRAGEPVIRVENNAEVLLLAMLIYRGPISIGSSVTVKTTLFDLPGPPTTIKGSVVVVRGQRKDDQWEAIVKCKNLDGGGKPIFPLGYQFDYDDTTASIT